MPFDIGDTLDRMLTYLSQSGHIRGGQQIGAYSQSVDTSQGAVGFITMVGLDVYAVTAGGQPMAQEVVKVTILLDALREPVDAVEKELALAATNIMADLLEEYDLGGSIRRVDPAGEGGASFSTRWGYIDISGKMYRMVDITIPLLVDWTDTAAP